MRINPGGLIWLKTAPLHHNSQRDVRSLPRNHYFKPDKDIVEAAIELIRNQNIEDSVEIGEIFENPALKTFWGYIESVALGTPLEEELSDDDDTNMNVEGILAATGYKINAFKVTIPKDEIVPKLPTKREAKIRPISDGKGIDWFHKYNMDAFDELRLQELKEYFRSYGEIMSGRKNELIERIKSHIRCHMWNDPKLQ